MRRIKVYFNRFKKQLLKLISKFLNKLNFKYKILKITFLSLFYNHQLSYSYAINTIFEPFFWLLDNFIQSLGPFFVILIVTLISIFVIIAYIFGLTFWLDRSLKVSIFALILGNYILINVIFHYFMAWKTKPGLIPSNIIIKNSISICKKCIIPKPPRTHHCSVCDKCILKMDHHCPWLNNCIGFYNHRYFFTFCLFVWIGTIFVFILGLPISLDHYYKFDITKNDYKNFLSFYSNKTRNNYDNSDNIFEHNNKKYIEKLGFKYYNVKNNCIIFATFSSISCFFAIGVLVFWHSKLITKGETCIESLINEKERLRLKEINVIFVNPFDKGWKKNWQDFFGLSRQKGIRYRHILFPSTHKPNGNGIEWDNII